METFENKDYADVRKFGYFSTEYGNSFSEFGNYYRLPNSETGVLSRVIPISIEDDTIPFDLQGLYPVVIPYDMAGLLPDVMRSLDREFVSLTAVIDPFNAFHYFPNAPEINLGGPLNAYRFKPHVIVNVSSGKPREDYSKHHFDRVKKAWKKNPEIYFSDSPSLAAVAWWEMQSELNRKKDITGIKAMSEDMINQQVKVKGLEVVMAYIGNELAGISTWMVHKGTAYSHTTAMTELGRKYMVGYSMYDFAIHNLNEKYPELSAISLGSYFSVPKIKYKTVNGLDYFKQGWSSTRLYSYLLTAILNQRLYDKLCKASDTEGVTDYFPAYRNGELLHNGKE